MKNTIYHSKLLLLVAAMAGAVLFHSPAMATSNFDVNGGVGGGSNVSAGANTGSFGVGGVTAGGATVNTSSGTGTIAEQTCDTQVWQTMENRARLETEREIMQNQNLIFKGDSVLNYVCFDKFAGHASERVGVLFTHTSYWQPQPFPWEGKNGAPGMPKAMQDVVVASMKTYTTSNFDHEYLGGRGKELGLSKPTVSDISGHGGTYACGEMTKVWAVAKCMNFMHTAEFAKNDGFYPFKDLKPVDGGQQVAGYETTPERRQYPTPCSGGQPIENGWATMTNFSRNSENGSTYDKYYKYSTKNNEAFTKVRELVEPGKCNGKSGIKTGVKIILQPGGKGDKDDGVCTNPGCTYKDGKCN